VNGGGGKASKAYIFGDSTSISDYTLLWDENTLNYPIWKISSFDNYFELTLIKCIQPNIGTA
jgi:hypothetical protein